MQRVPVISGKGKSMKRRDFVKAMAALPIVGATASLISTCNPSHLQVILQGPFGLMINTAINGDRPWGVRAFVPVHNREHMFMFNNSPENKDSNYKFQLKPDGLKPNPFPTLNRQFERFYFEHALCNFDTNYHFMTIELPYPERINIRSSFSNATMMDGKQFEIPGDHILEYKIINRNIVEMSGWENSSTTAIPLKSKNQIFTFEVGLPNHLGGNDSDQNGTHAVEFYDNSLLLYFPDLAKNKANNILQVSPHSHPKTTTLECKIGGLIVTTTP